MTEVESSPAQTNLKRKHDNDSEDELFFEFESGRKKRISDEVDKKLDEKREVQNENKENIKDKNLKEINNSPANLSTNMNSPVPKQNKMVQMKLSFGTKSPLVKPKEETKETAKKTTNETKKGDEIDLKEIAKLDKKEEVEKEEITLDPVVIRPDGDWMIEDYLREREWKNALKDEFSKKYFMDINKVVKEGYAKNLVRPPKELVFNAFNSTKLSKIKCVILGQDPYHDDGQAHGLCFSVPVGVRLPPSLRNIFQELKTDIPEFERDESLGGYLQKWTTEGIFMLNAFLTVIAHKAASHSGIGWDIFTDKVIKVISERTNNVVFLLWGNFAQKKEVLIDKKKHKIIKCAHPSPFSAQRFFGTKCFSQANNYLISVGKKPINWSLKKS